MSKFIEKLRALEMRRNGMSIKHIARELSVSPGTVSVWCNDVVLTPEQRSALVEAQIKAGHKGRLLGAQANKNRRLKNIEEQQRTAKHMVGRLSKRDIFMLGIALYWGEGVKARSSSIAIVNSDPAVVLLAKKWFQFLGVTSEMFRPTVYISESHADRIRLVTDYWSRVLDMPPNQFANAVFIKQSRKKVYENHNSYYGVLSLRVLKGMTLKYRILGLIKACKESADVAQW